MNKTTGIKHLIQCHCILPQYRNRKDPVFHQFIAFSEIDSYDNVVEKHVQCQNCGVVHKIIDVCQSEVETKSESLNTMITEQDIKMMIPSGLSEILENYNADLHIWEHAEHIVRNSSWGSMIQLTREETDSADIGKFLVIDARDRFRIDVKSSDRFVGENNG